MGRWRGSATLLILHRQAFYSSAGFIIPIAVRQRRREASTLLVGLCVMLQDGFSEELLNVQSQREVITFTTTSEAFWSDAGIQEKSESKVMRRKTRLDDGISAKVSGFKVHS